MRARIYRYKVWTGPTEAAEIARRLSAFPGVTALPGTEHVHLYSRLIGRDLVDYACKIDPWVAKWIAPAPPGFPGGLEGLGYRESDTAELG